MNKIEEIQLKINNRFNSKNKYKILEFKGNDDKNSIFKCLKCNNIFKSSVHYLLRKNHEYNCPFCEVSSKNMSLDQFMYKFNQNELSKDYTLVNFDGYTKGFMLRHKKCKKEFKTNGQRYMIDKQRCPYCFKSIAYTTDQYKKMIHDCDPNYELLSEYKNEKTKIKLLHKKCKKEYFCLPRNFLYNENRCPYCKTKSKREILVVKILDANNVKYIKEKKFDNCTNKRKLSFDFYINDSIILEIDGEQHFRKRRHDYDNSVLEKTIINDKIKNKFCEDNKISLIRIPFIVSDKEFKNTIYNLIRNDFVVSSTTIENKFIMYGNYDFEKYSNKVIEYLNESEI